MVLLVLTLAFSAFTLFKAWKLVKSDMGDCSWADLWKNKGLLGKVVGSVGWVVAMNALMWTLFFK